MEETIGKRIMRHRKRLGLTQDQLAEKLGVTAQAVSKWENDLSCPDIAMLPRLTAIFGISADALLGTEQEEILRDAEVVQEDSDSDEPLVHVQKGNWEFKMDAGRKGTLAFALLVLAVGVQLLLAAALDRDLSFWTILWPTALLALGIPGLWQNFSFFSLGCLLFGAYFTLDHWDVLPFSIGGNLVFPVIIVIFGVSLLIDALKKPLRPKFHFKHNGKAQNQCSYTADGTGFDYSASFSEDTQFIVLDNLSQGKISTSFGDYTVDLTGVNAVTKDCTLEASCSFGELTLLIPRRFAVQKNTSSTAFAEFSLKGEPNPDPHGIIHLDTSVNFGEITVKFV